MDEVASARQLLEERADNDGEGWVRETMSPQDDDATIMARLAADIGEGHLCNIRAQSDKAKLLREAKLIVWDEAPMTHRHCFEAVDRTMRDLFRGIEGQEWRQNIAFGGKVRGEGGRGVR